jgi:iron complex transport system permease protein
MRMFQKHFIVILILLAVSAAVLVCAAFAGMKFITPAMVATDQFSREIFWQMRVPRVLAAFLAGSGLALCGMAFQALFRNPMADPFTLGTASGASCGAAATILFGLGGSVLGVPVISIGSFCGAALAVACVYGIASLKRTSSPMTMLLAGISVSFLFSSVLMFMQYVSSLRDSFQIVRWLMGGIQAVGYTSLAAMLPFWLLGTLLVALQLPRLDHLLTGEDLARSRGVDVARTKQVLLVAATLLVGGIVAVCGPIGFVGLMVPHICRRILSAHHLFLGPASLLAGGIFLVVADTFGRTIIAPAELPVGVITALFGGPFFLWLLFWRRKEDFVF